MTDIFLLLVLNILPLYGLMALGYIGGRWLDVNLHSMAIVAIYLVAPIVNFGAMTRLEFDPRYAILPVVLFICSIGISALMYRLAEWRWKTNSANLIAMGSVSGNTGYFGLPVVMALAGPDWVGLYLFMNLSLVLSENTFGYYIGARGEGDIRTALRKVIRLPVIHAVWLGLLANFLGFHMPDVLNRYWTYATGAWIFIGMMLIGVALGKLPKLEFEPRLIRWLFLPKFLLWPLAGFTIALADRFIWQAFDPIVHQLLIVFTCVPLAGNLVAFAANLRLHAERAAATVLASTLLALLFLPAMLTLYRLIAG